MEFKTVTAEMEALPEKGMFKARFSVFGNVDEGSDRMVGGAFTRTFEERPDPPVVWSHRWDVPPIGQTLEATQTAQGAEAVGRLFVGADDDHEVARQVYSGLKSGALREFSFGFSVRKAGEETIGNRKVRVIHDVDLYEWGPTLVGMNRQTALLGVKDALLTPSPSVGALHVVLCSTCGFMAENAKAGDHPDMRDPSLAARCTGRDWKGLAAFPLSPGEPAPPAAPEGRHDNDPDPARVAQVLLGRPR